MASFWALLNVPHRNLFSGAASVIFHLHNNDDDETDGKDVFHTHDDDNDDVNDDHDNDDENSLPALPLWSSFHQWLPGTLQGFENQPGSSNM